MYKYALIITGTLISGCATLDKAMTPVDKGINSTKTVIQNIDHSIGETMSNLGNSVSDMKAGLMESSLMQMFVSDDTILENRQNNYVTWEKATQYNANSILKQALKETDINDPEKLKTSQKMSILKDYFFQLLKEEHANKFSKYHKKPEFNEFLTDRENIQKIYEYKLALKESEHDWKISLRKTQKKVAELMLSTLYAKPIVKYVSYNPYEEEMFLSIEASNGGFKEKIKIDAKKDLAISMKKNISHIQPYIFYKFDNDILNFVGINIKFNEKPHLCEVVDSTYVRQSDVVFTSDEINLDSLNVKYYDIVKNIKPPSWFNNLTTDEKEIIGYGEGLKKDDAKKEAYKEIAMSIRTTISTNIKSEKVVSGSKVSSHSTSNTQQKVEDISIKGSKVLKVEKKDGLWFVAIRHNNKR